jgi:hypothetical protein
MSSTSQVLQTDVTRANFQTALPQIRQALQVGVCKIALSLLLHGGAPHMACRGIISMQLIE